MPVQTISPTRSAEALQNSSAILIDVRSPAEFDALHAQGARLMPLDTIDPKQVAALRPDPTTPIYLICQSGGRSAKAWAKLNDAGIPNIHSVDGGTKAWEAAGLPITRGTGKTISIERQVRIVAGSLVLISAILALTIHIAFIALAAFIGAGLTFAGITDFCGMGILLSKMPWNQRRTPPAATCKPA
jgi:rhodanese-related sulfurtransferase